MRDRRRCSWHAALVGVALVVGATAALSAQAPRLEDLLPAVTAYVSDFIPKFASVVAVETFEQRFRVPGVGAVNPFSGITSPWRLKSDVLLVQDPAKPDDWVLVLALMQPRYYPRLRIVVGGEQRTLGAGVRLLRFEDRDESAPVLDRIGSIRGNLWIEQRSGRIVKTEARIGGALNASTTVTTFAHHERLAMLVPSEMRTTWVHRDAQGGRSLGQVQGTAKYVDFRRFGVQTESSIIEQ